MKIANTPLEGRSAALGVALLVAASLALTLGFACAVPLAAFAAIAALIFDLPAAALAVVAVWLANQAVGFGVMHYPLNATTFAWGGALGGLGLAALVAARVVVSRLGGLAGAAVAFLAAFVAYEGLLYGIDVVAGLDPAVFLLPVVERIFAINLVAFGLLLAASALSVRLFSKAQGQTPALASRA
jgi:uncharacterized membrane protein YjgN (DUF898 family)